MEVDLDSETLRCNAAASAVLVGEGMAAFHRPERSIVNGGLGRRHSAMKRPRVNFDYGDVLQMFCWERWSLADVYKVCTSPLL